MALLCIQSSQLLQVVVFTNVIFILDLKYAEQGNINSRNVHEGPYIARTNCRTNSVKPILIGCWLLWIGVPVQPLYSWAKQSSQSARSLKTKLISTTKFVKKDTYPFFIKRAFFPANTHLSNETRYLLLIGKTTSWNIVCLLLACQEFRNNTNFLWHLVHYFHF